MEINLTQLRPTWIPVPIWASPYPCHYRDDHSPPQCARGRRSGSGRSRVLRRAVWYCSSSAPGRGIRHDRRTSGLYPVRSLAGRLHTWYYMQYIISPMCWGHKNLIKSIATQKCLKVVGQVGQVTRSGDSGPYPLQLDVILVGSDSPNVCGHVHVSSCDYNYGLKLDMHACQWYPHQWLSSHDSSFVPSTESL